jgi:hypothetical protein
VLKNVRARKCPATRCPSNGRGYHLNRLFRDIERLRGAGRLDEVRAWAADLRDVLPEPTHSFFL